MLLSCSSEGGFLPHSIYRGPYAPYPSGIDRSARVSFIPSFYYLAQFSAYRYSFSAPLVLHTFPPVNPRKRHEPLIRPPSQIKDRSVRLELYGTPRGVVVHRSSHHHQQLRETILTLKSDLGHLYSSSIVRASDDAARLSRAAHSAVSKSILGVSTTDRIIGIRF